MIIYGFAKIERIVSKETGGIYGSNTVRVSEIEKDLPYLGFYSSRDMAQKRIDRMLKDKPYIKEYELKTSE
jgi:hypothetical protein